jgi:hypothetical protein
VVAPPKRNTKTRPSLKGSRKLQNFDFSGGFISGTGTGGGTATGIGSAQTMDALGSADATGIGSFNSNSGGSGFIDSVFGMANGSGSGGATGSQDGSVNAMLGTGTLTFDGTTTSSGTGGFGAGFSPVNFNAVTTEVPGSAIQTFGSPKKGKLSSGFSDPTFVTTVVPVSTGPTGGFGTGSGSLDIASTTTGTLLGDDAVGTGSSTGTATNFGGGEGTGLNYFGSAGGLGSGTGTGTGTGSGNTAADPTGGTFTGTGTAIGNFDNGGFGIFGTNGVLGFP